MQIVMPMRPSGVSTTGGAPPPLYSGISNSGTCIFRHVPSTPVGPASTCVLNSRLPASSSSPAAMSRPVSLAMARSRRTAGPSIGSAMRRAPARASRNQAS